MSVGKTAVKRDWLGYTEKKDNLAIRIEANIKYTDLKLEDWLLKHLPVRKGQTMLDIGCGGGNLFPTFGKKVGPQGIIVGADKSDELLAEARKVKAPGRRVLMSWNMNDPLPFLEGTFDCVVSTFAIYYVDDVNAMTKSIHKVLKPRASVMLIGPGDRNAWELYEFNKQIFGIGKDEKVNQRSSRLENEFYPAIKEVFKNVKLTTIPINLVFPNKKEYIRYYLATLLYEESVRKTGKTVTPQELMAMPMSSLKISKEVVVVRGTKAL